MTSAKPSDGAVDAARKVEGGIWVDDMGVRRLPPRAPEIIDRLAVAPAVAELVAALDSSARRYHDSFEPMSEHAFHVFGECPVADCADANAIIAKHRRQA